MTTTTLPRWEDTTPEGGIITSSGLYIRPEAVPARKAIIARWEADMAKAMQS